MNKNIFSISIIFIAMLVVQMMLPASAKAAAPFGTDMFNINLIPCGNYDGKDAKNINDLRYPTNYPDAAKAGKPIPAAEQCGLPEFFILIRNVMNFMFLISIPIATIAFMWTGVILLTSQGNPSKIQRAKGIALKVLIGFLFVISGWAIVYEITRRLFTDSYQYLGLNNNTYENTRV